TPPSTASPRNAPSQARAGGEAGGLVSSAASGPAASTSQTAHAPARCRRSLLRLPTSNRLPFMVRPGCPRRRTGLQAAERRPQELPLPGPESRHVLERLPPSQPLESGFDHRARGQHGRLEAQALREPIPCPQSPPQPGFEPGILDPYRTERPLGQRLGG